MRKKGESALASPSADVTELMPPSTSRSTRRVDRRYRRVRKPAKWRFDCNGERIDNFSSRIDQYARGQAQTSGGRFPTDFIAFSLGRVAHIDWSHVHPE